MAINPNNQFLAGLACPECGSFGPFYIDTLAVALICDSGVVSIDGQDDWNYDSNCRCPKCENEGEVKEFYREEATRAKT